MNLWHLENRCEKCSMRRPEFDGWRRVDPLPKMPIALFSVKLATDPVQIEDTCFQVTGYLDAIYGTFLAFDPKNCPLDAARVGHIFVNVVLDTVIPLVSLSLCQVPLYYPPMLFDMGERTVLIPNTCWCVREYDTVDLDQETVAAFLANFKAQAGITLAYQPTRFLKGQEEIDILTKEWQCRSRAFNVAEMKLVARAEDNGLTEEEKRALKICGEAHERLFHSYIEERFMIKEH